MRVRGGTAGLLAALEHGVCDELSAAEPVEVPVKRRLSLAEVRAYRRREEERLRARLKRNEARRREQAKALAERPPF